MDSAAELLKSNMARISRLMNTGGMRHWCALGLFVAFFLMALWYLFAKR